VAVRPLVEATLNALQESLTYVLPEARGVNGFRDGLSPIVGGESPQLLTLLSGQLAQEVFQVVGLVFHTFIMARIGAEVKGS
jgi:hypothetical protein